MIRVLHVLSSLKKNGTETFVMNVFRNIDRSKIMFDFLVLNDEKEGFYDEIISLGGRVYFLPPRRHNFIKYHKNLDKFFSVHSQDYSAVHLHGMSLTTVAPLFYARKYGIKTRVAHVHGKSCQGRHNQIFHKINRKRLPKLATHFLSCSSEASSWGYGTTKAYSRSEIIPNGINIENYRFNPEKRKELRRGLRIKDEELALLHVGSFNPIKNQKFLLDVFSSSKKKRTDLKLICVGEGGLLNDMVNYAKTLEISDRVFFLGQRDDIPDLMSASDLFLFPSIHEGLGLVAIEAQANGMPVIASTGVPTEGVVSKDFQRIDLKDGIEPWVKIIGDYEIPVNRIVDPGIYKYDINTTCKLLTSIYTIQR
ncbi:MAG: glycosyltransferase family 1 protein [Muribaculaceae bacterium]|nr:glycosyltransferase family 1 protein [Muribaculaceae bacterium]